jgi:hypothetical protein
MDSAARAESGLLEQAVLVVRAEGDRRVLLTASGDEVGYTRWQQRGWWRGGPWSVLALHEHEQSPLVCTIRRRLLPRHEVRDAEGELVGVLAGAHVLDRWDRVVMWRDDSGFVGEHGEVLARWSGGRLELLPLVQRDPFAKMLIVAVAVAQ